MKMFDIIKQMNLTFNYSYQFVTLCIFAITLQHMQINKTNLKMFMIIMSSDEEIPKNEDVIALFSHQTNFSKKFLM